MSSFIYAPQIKVYIETGGNPLTKSKVQTLDVTDDIVRGRLTRRVDGVSDFQFTLLNPRRKYDQVFTPNDRITVLMKRVTWLRVFTGYLNQVPLLTAWPRNVDLTASCSLKRLQYWYWDPESAYTQQMIMNALSAAAGTGKTNDGGMTNVVLTILKEVVGWPESKVHIAKIPDDWFKIAYKIAEQVDKTAQESDDLAQQFFQSLGGAGSVGTSGGELADTSGLGGKYGGYNSKEQLSNAVKIYNAGRQVGATKDDQIIAIMTAMQESGLVNLSGGDRDSVGLFQQRPSQGWGTVAQCRDPTYAAKKFFSVLFNVPNHDKMPKAKACQAVQRSAFPDAYAKHEPAATALVNDMAKKGGTSTVTGSGSKNSTESKPSAKATGTCTNKQLIQVAKDLVTTYPNIPYTQKYGGTQLAVISKNPPPGLDCSSFVQAVVLRALGALYGFPRTTTTQQPYCRKISAEVAFKTPGALLFKGSPPYHVEMSIGDGKHSVGAHRTGTYASIQESSASYWTSGGLIPRVDYGKLGMGDGDAGGGAVTDTPGATAAATIYTDPYSSTPGYNANDPFDKLFGDTAWQPVASQKNDTGYILSQSLTGIKSLLNDQPLLPYLKNLFSATMRSFCSAPNGDLISWFPDYYGLWGTAAKMVVQPIEVRDFSVTWDDSFFVTHQFVATTPQGGAGQNGLNLATGEVSSLVGAALDPLVVAQNLSYTRGIASIDVPALMYALFKIDATESAAKDFSKWIYQRFGARPDFQQLPNLVGPSAQFFASIYYFMRQWAYQYSADIPLTFMPELYPGMLLQIPAFSFQGYVNTVVHDFQFGDEGYFNTSVNISAPARLSDTGNAADVLIGLPRAGGLIGG